MDTLDYWTPDDALAFRCSVEQVGTLKPAALMPGGETGITDLARAYAPRMLRALARIAETSDGRAGVEAAQALLAYAYPPAPASQPASAPDLPAPEWLDGQRLSYQYQPGQCLPSQPLPSQASAPVSTHFASPSEERDERGPAKACLRQVGGG